MGLMVYDETIKSFRKLIKTNYNDDIICGTVFLNREALSEIKKFFYICGYMLIDKKHGCMYPIDIHKDKIVIFGHTPTCYMHNIDICYDIWFDPIYDD